MSREQRQQIRTRLQRPSAASETTPTLEQIRTGFAQMMSAMRNAEDVAVAETELDGHRTLRVDPDGEAGPGTILYFHGGSHRMGSPETAMSLTSALVSLTGFAAFSVDYPLSPEHPYPADQEVCLAAYRELLDRGTDPQSIVIAGDSAGGGLTMSTALRARDAGLPFRPACSCSPRAWTARAAASP